MLEDRIGHRFASPDLLREAMAHRSWVAEHPGGPDNERLEFLGDAVLGWVVADLVYHRFPDLPEGGLSELRKSAVNAAALAEVARGLGLGDHLLLGRGEDAAGGRDKPSLLSNAFEAVLGAVYLDAGVEAATALVHRVIGPRLLDAPSILDRADEKSALQELAARVGWPAPRYHVTARGPDHAKRFTAEVHLDGRVVGRGEGSSKKEAEQVAAGAARSALRDDAAAVDAAAVDAVDVDAAG